MSFPHIPAPDCYDRMPFRKCGKWGLKLPAISLGAAFETIGGRLGYRESRDILLRAFDLGIAHFDLANNYGRPPGTAETLVGRVLRELPRDEITVSTKAGFRMGPGPYGYGLSKKYLTASLDRSLQRLNLDYVDFFYAHTPDEETPLEESLAAMDLFVRQGKAIYLGLANFTGRQYEEAVRIIEKNGLTPIAILQNPYNILARGLESDLFPSLERHGTGLAAFYVLGQGVLSGKYQAGTVPSDTRVATHWTETDRKIGLTQRARDQIARLEPIARKRGQTLAQMCISWVLRDSRVTTAILGATRTSQVLENAGAALSLHFSEEEIREIESISPGPKQGE